MDRPEVDGLIPYTLGRDYGEYKAGTTLRVDPERRTWLDENGYRLEVRTPPSIPIHDPAALPSRFSRRRADKEA